MTYDLKFTVRGNLDEVQQQLREFGRGAATAKKQGAEIGEGLRQGASGIRSAITQIRDSLQGIQRQLAESQAATAAVRKAEREANAQAAQDRAEAKRQQQEITAEVNRRAQAEQAAAARNIANARQLAAENARISAKRADSIAAFSAATPEQLRTPAERTDAIGREQVLRRDAELRMLEINRRADALEQRLAATRGKLAGATRTATGETQRAIGATQGLNREVALALPQLTDISVGLASGQSPFLVAIQQGGQLRDIFGGFRPAISAFGSALVSLVNPVTITVAAIAGIGYAYLKGQEEGLRFNRILALTGNAAGKTADQLSLMAAQMTDIEGVTRASASETIAAVAESGKFTAAQFELVSRASEKMRQATGRDIGEVVGEFEKLADSPAEAVVELNRKYNFLTGSILEQIRTLQEQGRTQEAATLAMQAFANAVDKRTPEIVENLGYIERGVRKVKDLLREAGDGFLSLGRQSARADFNKLFSERQDLLADAQNGNGFARARIAMIDAELRKLQDAEVAAQKKATQDAARARAVELQNDLENDARQFETAQQKRARQRVAAINRANEAIAQATVAKDPGAAAAAKRARDEIIANIDKQDKEDADRKAKSAASATAAAARKSNEAAKQAANTVRAESALVEDSTRRALQELDRLYAQGAISIKDFYAQKQKLELEANDAAVRAAEAQLKAAVDIDERKAAETELTKLQRDRAEITVRAAREQAIAERELANELQTLQARLAEANGKLGEEERVRLEQERDALLRKFQSNPGAQKLVKDLFDVELAKARANAINAERDKILGKLRDQTDYINAQVELGGLSPVDAEQQLQEARQKSLDQLEELRKKAQEAYGEKPPEAVHEALRQLDTEILQVKSSQESLKNAAKQQATDSLTQFFTDLSTGAKSFKDAFKDLVRSFIQGLARMAAEAVAKRIIFSIFGGAGGGGGIGGLFGIGSKHSGGMIGHGTTRAIPAAAFPVIFAGAPRFHSGGPILAPGEVPIIAQTGERVLSREENKRYSSMVAAASRSAATRVVNVFDRQFVPDQMDSSDGERVILNIIGRNPGRVKQLLG